MPVRKYSLSRSAKEMFAFLILFLSAFVGLRAVWGESVPNTGTATYSTGGTTYTITTSTGSGSASVTSSTTTSSADAEKDSGETSVSVTSTSSSGETTTITTTSPTNTTVSGTTTTTSTSGTGTTTLQAPASVTAPTTTTTTVSPLLVPKSGDGSSLSPTTTYQTVTSGNLVKPPILGTEPLPRRQEGDSSPLSDVEKIRNAKQELISLTTIDRARFEVSEEDTDNDTIPDTEEMRLGTDPRSADTDHDGYLDGAEVFGGFNPLVFSPGDGRDKVTFEAAKEKKTAETPRTDERYAVQSIERAASKTDPEKSVLRLSGKGAPNRLLTLYIYSDPIVVTVKTDGDGNWTYDLDKELPDGDHEVYVAVTDSVGKVAAVSEPLPFVKTAQAVTVRSAAALEAERNASPLERSRTQFILVAVVVSLTFLGVAIVFIGRRSSFFTR